MPNSVAVPGTEVAHLLSQMASMLLSAFLSLLVLQATQELKQLMADSRIIPVLCEVLASSSNAQVCTVWE